MRLTAAVVAAFLLANAVTLFVIQDYVYPKHGYPNTPYRIFFAIGFAESMLVAAWLGTAKSNWRHLIWLLIYAVCATLFFLCMQWLHGQSQFIGNSLSLNALRHFFAVGLGVIVCALPLAVICRRRLTLGRADDVHHIPELFRMVVSLKGIFFVVTVLAALLALGNKPFGLMKTLVESKSFSVICGRIVELATMSPVVVLACWSTFGPRIRWVGLALCFALGAIGEVVISWYLVGGGGSVSIGVFDKFLVVTLVLIPLILYRTAGVRWTEIEHDSEAKVSMVDNAL